MFGRSASKSDSIEPERSPFELAILEGLRQEDDDAITAALLEHDLVVPADGPPPTDAEGNPQLAMPVWTREGQQYAIAFSSEAQREAATPDWSGAIMVPGAAYFAALATGLGFALNPGGDFGVAFEPGDVELIKQRLADGDPDASAGGPSFQLGEPAEEDEAVLAAARSAAETRPEIRALRRALLLVREEGRRPQLVVGVELDPMPTDPAAIDALLEDIGAGLPEGVALAPIGADRQPAEHLHAGGDRALLRAGVGSAVGSMRTLRGLPPSRRADSNR